MLLHIAQLSGGGGGGKVYLISQRERRGGPAACPAPLIHLPLAAAPLWATDRGVSPPSLSPHTHTHGIVPFSPLPGRALRGKEASTPKNARYPP